MARSSLKEGGNVLDVQILCNFELVLVANDVRDGLDLLATSIDGSTRIIGCLHQNASKNTCDEQREDGR